VTSLPAVTLIAEIALGSVKAESTGQGGGGWVHPKSADSMAVSGFRFGDALVGSEWSSYARMG